MDCEQPGTNYDRIAAAIVIAMVLAVLLVVLRIGELLVLPLYFAAYMLLAAWLLIPRAVFPVTAVVVALATWAWVRQQRRPQ